MMKTQRKTLHIYTKIKKINHVPSSAWHKPNHKTKKTPMKATIRKKESFPYHPRLRSEDLGHGVDTIIVTFFLIGGSSVGNTTITTQDLTAQTSKHQVI